MYVDYKIFTRRAFYSFCVSNCRAFFRRLVEDLPTSLEVRVRYCGWDFSAPRRFSFHLERETAVKVHGHRAWISRASRLDEVLKTN